MSLDVIIALVGLVTGGIGQWWWASWRNRKTDARKEDAAADSMEDENTRKQIDWLEKRITERDLKVDATYRELRQEQSEKLEWIFKYHALELNYKDAEYNRCNMPDGECIRRIPPRRPVIINKQEEII